MDQQAALKLEERCSGQLTMRCKMSHCPSYSEETAARISALGYIPSFAWGMYYPPISRKETIAVCRRYDKTATMDSLQNI